MKHYRGNGIPSDAEPQPAKNIKILLNAQVGLRVARGRCVRGQEGSPGGRRLFLFYLFGGCPTFSNQGDIGTAERGQATSP